MRQASLPSPRAINAAASLPSGEELTFLEVPVFDPCSQAFADYLAGTLVTPPPQTLMRLASAPFLKDGVWVHPASDHLNADCKATACGCLYWFKGGELPWPYHRVEPVDIVWRRAPRHWRARQARHDWTTLEANRPEIAPWLREEEANA